MLSEDQLHDLNQPLLAEHNLQFDYLADLLARRGLDAHQLILQLVEFQVAIPSWALGTGGTRFGRFPAGGEPRSLEEKIMDVGMLNQLNGSSNSISLHIPWDIPQDVPGLHQLLQAQGLSIDSMNSNTFQDQKDQAHSYKFGSLSATDRTVREQAIQHNIECINYGTQLGAKVHTVWLADGSNFPGQSHLRRAYLRTQESLAAIYEALPSDWTMLIEYKPYEPNFYSMVPEPGQASAGARGPGPPLAQYQHRADCRSPAAAKPPGRFPLQRLGLRRRRLDDGQRQAVPALLDFQ
jgi:L-rhamnose isomerase/sugar isomerase